MKYAHSCISQHMLAQSAACWMRWVHAIKYSDSIMTACLFQPYGSDGEWRLTTDSNHAGNAEVHNKWHSQRYIEVGACKCDSMGQHDSKCLAHMAMQDAGRLGQQSDCGTDGILARRRQHLEHC